MENALTELTQSIHEGVQVDIDGLAWATTETKNALKDKVSKTRANIAYSKSVSLILTSPT